MVQPACSGSVFFVTLGLHGGTRALNDYEDEAVRGVSALYMAAQEGASLLRRIASIG